MYCKSRVLFDEIERGGRDIYLWQLWIFILMIIHYMKRFTRPLIRRAAELIETAGMKAGQILVVGCSTSEVGGEKIGTYSSPELAAKVFGGIYEAVQEKGIYLAAQCCEHLNRALILETEAAEKYGYEPVNVMPQPKAGGSFATAACRHLLILWQWSILRHMQEWISEIR